MTVCILTGCSGSSGPPSSPSIYPDYPFSTKADLAVCNTLTSDFYYPTIPPTGKTVTPTSAGDVLALLKQANDPSLRTAVPGLERAIKAHDETTLVTIFSNLQSVCWDNEGVVPAT